MSDWSHLDNIDPELVRVFEEDTDQPLRVILVLRLSPDEGPLPRLEDYKTRKEWVQVLRERRAKWMEQAVAPTVEALRNLGIDHDGGEFGQLMLRGTARQIRQAVALPGVRLALLNFLIGFDWSGEEHDTHFHKS